jgi:hypothetical protein
MSSKPLLLLLATSYSLFAKNMWPSGNHGANFFCKMLFCAGLALSMNARHQIVLATSIALTLWALPAYAQNGQQAASQSDQEPGRTGHAVNEQHNNADSDNKAPQALLNHDRASVGLVHASRHTNPEIAEATMRWPPGRLPWFSVTGAA